MGAGIAVEFNKRFSCKAKIKAKYDSVYKNCGGIPVGTVILTDRVFSLITKKVYHGKPTYQTLTEALSVMRMGCIARDIKYIAMPKIGCGLDRLSWGKVRDIIQEMFKEDDIEILVCSL